MEKLKTAVRYGADAVYFGGEVFSLRAGAGNLTVDEMKEAMEFLHTHGAKGYLTINIYPHNEDILPLQEYIQQIRDIPIDAFRGIRSGGHAAGEGWNPECRDSSTVLRPIPQTT